MTNMASYVYSMLGTEEAKYAKKVTGSYINTTLRLGPEALFSAYRPRTVPLALKLRHRIYSSKSI